MNYAEPKNNWEMAEMLKDGLVCKVASKCLADVVKALDYHGICAEVEADENVVIVTPKEK
jgi:hypothetical protein